MNYEFYCENCNFSKTLSLFVKDRNQPIECDKCSQLMVRQIGTPGMIFKGSGFYTTDVLHKKTMKKQALKEKEWRKENGD